MILYINAHVHKSRHMCLYVHTSRYMYRYITIYIDVYADTSRCPCLHVAIKSGYMSLHARTSRTSSTSYIVLHPSDLVGPKCIVLHRDTCLSTSMYTYIPRATCGHTSIHRNTRIYSIVYINVYVHTSWYPCLHVANKLGYMSLQSSTPTKMRTSRIYAHIWYIMIHPPDWDIMIHHDTSECIKRYPQRVTLCMFRIHHHTRSYTRVCGTYGTSWYTVMSCEIPWYTVIPMWVGTFYVVLHDNACYIHRDTCVQCGWAHFTSSYMIMRVTYFAIHVFTRPYIVIHVANNHHTCLYTRLHVFTRGGIL
jgi:hypothetical protein